MLSIIVPVLNEGSGIREFLVELRERFPSAELLVVDGGSTDDSVGEALGFADAVLIGEAGRAAQMNLGARTARGDWLCFLHADTPPEFNEAELASALGSSPRWAFCRVHLVGRSRGLSVVAWCMNRRSALTSVATGDQMLMVEQGLFEEIGGFATVRLMEDVEICKRLRRHAVPLPLRLRVSASGRRWDEHGLIRTIVHMWVLRLAFWLGVPPDHLWRYYYGERAPGASTS